MSIQYFVHYNRDYNEAMTHHDSVRDAYEAIRAEMRIELPVTDPGIGEAISDAYESGNWKGPMIYRFDPGSGQITTVGEDELQAEIAVGGDSAYAPMTPSQYMDFGGQQCPLCRSHEISGEAPEVDVLTAWQPVSCSDCGAEWDDLYGMTGYELTFDPTTQNQTQAA